MATREQKKKLNKTLTDVEKKLSLIEQRNGYLFDIVVPIAKSEAEAIPRQVYDAGEGRLGVKVIGKSGGRTKAIALEYIAATLGGTVADGFVTLSKPPKKPKNEVNPNATAKTNPNDGGSD